MNGIELIGWDRLRHGGLLLDPPRLRRIAEHAPAPLSSYQERELRRQAGGASRRRRERRRTSSRFVLEEICGFTAANGSWQRGPQVGAEWGRRAVTGETVKPRQLWRGRNRRRPPRLHRRRDPPRHRPRPQVHEPGRPVAPRGQRAPRRSSPTAASGG